MGRPESMAPTTGAPSPLPFDYLPVRAESGTEIATPADPCCMIISMERDTNRWDGFSEQEMQEIYQCVGRLEETQLQRDLTEELRQRLWAEQDKKGEARTTSEHLEAAAEALRRSDTSQAGAGAVARIAETTALRVAVRAIIKHLEERP